MSGLQLGPLREAIADQIRQYVARGTHVAPYQIGDEYPMIEVRPGEGLYVDYTDTFGAAGYAEVHLDIVIICRGGGLEDNQRALDDYLSMGTGNGSGVVEALNSAELNGLCDDIRGEDGRIQAVDVTVTSEQASARIPIVVIVKKVGATV